MFAFLGNPEVFVAKMDRRNARIDGMDTELVAMRLGDEINNAVCKRERALNRAERVHIAKKVNRQRALPATVGDNQAAAAGFLTIREPLVARLEGATPGQRRWVMQIWDFRATAIEKVSPVSPGVPPRWRHPSLAKANPKLVSCLVGRRILCYNRSIVSSSCFGHRFTHFVGTAKPADGTNQPEAGPGASNTLASWGFRLASP